MKNKTITESDILCTGVRHSKHMFDCLIDCVLSIL